MNQVQPISDLPVFGSSENRGPAKATNKDDFLKLLVAQMRFQDPMNPLQGSEFAAQLAQFSSVEELQNINSKMDSQTEANLMLARSVNNTIATTLIGKQVRAADDRVTFNGDDDVAIKYNLASFASPLTIEIVSDQGMTVRTLQVSSAGSGDNTAEWDGRDGRGNRVPPGEYTVSISATGTNGNRVSAMPLAIGRIDGVRFENGNPILLMEGKAIPFGAVLEILEAPANQSFLSRILQEGN
jgi:flagellar basal-body rod modification protein FlgD